MSYGEKSNGDNSKIKGNFAPDTTMVAVIIFRVFGS